MSNLTWRKSTYSGDQGNCVELAEAGDHIAVRNSVLPDAGTLHVPSDAWARFLADVKAGEHG